MRPDQSEIEAAQLDQNAAVALADGQIGDLDKPGEVVGITLYRVDPKLTAFSQHRGRDSGGGVGANDLQGVLEVHWHIQKANLFIETSNEMPNEPQ
jgi:hypothetical protein